MIIIINTKSLYKDLVIYIKYIKYIKILKWKYLVLFV